jgi:ketosteroid isomerase-like protein
MKMNSSVKFLTLSIALSVAGSLASCTDTPKAPAEAVIINDTEDVKQAVLAMYEFVGTQDLSDSLTFNQWTSFFTSDFLWIGAKGTPPTAMGKDGFKGYRGAFKTIKATFDGITIDHVDTSGDLAYVVYHFHEVVTSLKTNEVVSDGLTSAVVTLKKDETGKWRIAFVAYT